MDTGGHNRARLASFCLLVQWEFISTTLGLVAGTPSYAGTGAPGKGTSRTIVSELEEDGPGKDHLAGGTPLPITSFT